MLTMIQRSLFAIADWMIKQLNRALLLIWDAPIFVTPHIIISLFYLIMTPLLTYLYFTYEGAFGLRAVELYYGIPPVFAIAIFQISGWVLAQRRSSQIYALCVMPMVLYAVAIALGSPEIGDLSILAVIYLITASLLGIASIRLRYEYNRYAEAIQIMKTQIAGFARAMDNDQTDISDIKALHAKNKKVNTESAVSEILEEHRD
jgi:hypothetical protein